MDFIERAWHRVKGWWPFVWKSEYEYLQRLHGRLQESRDMWETLALQLDRKASDLQKERAAWQADAETSRATAARFQAAVADALRGHFRAAALTVIDRADVHGPLMAYVTEAEVTTTVTVNMVRFSTEFLMGLPPRLAPELAADQAADHCRRAVRLAVLRQWQDQSLLHHLTGGEPAADS